MECLAAVVDGSRLRLRTSETNAYGQVFSVGAQSEVIYFSRLGQASSGLPMGLVGVRSQRRRTFCHRAMCGKPVRLYARDER